MIQQMADHPTRSTTGTHGRSHPQPPKSAFGAKHGLEMSYFAPEADKRLQSASVRFREVKRTRCLHRKMFDQLIVVPWTDKNGRVLIELINLPFRRDEAAVLPYATPAQIRAIQWFWLSFTAATIVRVALVSIRQHEVTYRERRPLWLETGAVINDLVWAYRL